MTATASNSIPTDAISIHSRIYLPQVRCCSVVTLLFSGSHHMSNPFPLCSTLVMHRCAVGSSKPSQAQALPVIVVAVVAERFAAALCTAASADQHATVNTHRNNRFATANCLSSCSVLKFDLAGCRHCRR